MVLHHVLYLTPHIWALKRPSGMTPGAVLCWNVASSPLLFVVPLDLSETVAHLADVLMV